MFGNKAQMQNMLKKARKMQEDMQKMQEELKQQTVDVSVGGGAVAIVMNGEDLITTAVNEAGKKADDMVQKGMSKVTGGLGLPGGMF